MEAIDDIMATLRESEASDGDTDRPYIARVYPDEAGYAALPGTLTGRGATAADAIDCVRAEVAAALESD